MILPCNFTHAALPHESDIAVHRKVDGVHGILDVGAVEQLAELVVDKYRRVVGSFDNDTLSAHIFPDTIPYGFTAVKGNFGDIGGKRWEAIHTAAARPVAHIKGGCRRSIRKGLPGDLNVKQISVCAARYGSKEIGVSFIGQLFRSCPRAVFYQDISGECLICHDPVKRAFIVLGGPFFVVCDKYCLRKLVPTLRCT